VQISVPAYVQAQQSSSAADRKKQIESLKEQVKRLEKLDELEQLEKSREETDARIRQLRSELQTGSPTRSTGDKLADTPPVERAQSGSVGELKTGREEAKSNVSSGQEKTDAVSSDTGSTKVVSDTEPAQQPDQRELILNRPSVLPDVAMDAVDAPYARLINYRYALILINQAIKDKILVDKDGAKPDPSQHDFYCVIHVLRWSDPPKAASTGDPALDAAPGPAQQNVESQNWYVYNNGAGKGFRGKWSDKDFASRNRIFGVKRVYLLYVHLNNQSTADYLARYDFSIFGKTPENISNLFRVAKLFTGQQERLVSANLWGGGGIDVEHVPSDITITAKFVPAAEKESNPGVALDKPVKFDNEGRYWWDVSVGVPMRRISQFEFQTTDNTLAPKEVNKQNIFALLNLYPIPADIKGTTYSWIPHFIGGVAIAKQPQNKIMIGAGFGPRFANFYLGSLFVKQAITDASDQGGATVNPKTRYKPQFTFGLNLPVRGIIEALKPKEKK
jgi:hypothetical protein